MLVFVIQERNHSLHVLVAQPELLILFLAGLRLGFKLLAARVEFVALSPEPVAYRYQLGESVPKLFYYYFLLVCHAFTKIDTANVRLFLKCSKFFVIYFQKIFFDVDFQMLVVKVNYR